MLVASIFSFPHHLLKKLLAQGQEVMIVWLRVDENVKFHENERKLSKQVENTVGKGEIARYEQFLLFHSVFKRLVFPRGVKRCHCVGMG